MSRTGLALSVFISKHLAHRKPSIFLEHPEGIERDAVRRLKEALERKALEMSQQQLVCIAELASLVRDFLYDLNERAQGRRMDSERQEAEEKRRRSLAEERAAEEKKKTEAKEVQLATDSTVVDFSISTDRFVGHVPI